MPARAVLCAFLLSLTAGALSGREYWVAATGQDTNDGSEAKPFREIRAAVKVVKAGDTVLISDGEYQGFDVTSIGAADKETLFKATGQKAVVVPSKDRDVSDAFNIVLAGCTKVVLDGLRTFKGPTAGLRVFQCANVTVRNGVFGDNGKWGIVTSHCTDLLIENNDCYGSRIEHGIYVANSGDRPVVRGNRIHDNAGSGLRSNGDINEGGDGIISGAVYENNIIYNNGTSKENGGAAVNLDGLQDSIIRNNVLYNNHATGIALFKGCGAAGPRGMQVLNNTIIMATDARFCLRITDAAGSILVRNNILYNLNIARGPFSWDTKVDVDATDSDYNVIGGGNYVAPDAKGPKISFTYWRSDGRERNSAVAVTPGFLFHDPSTDDYRLKTYSPALDRGVLVPDAPLDINGVKRPQGKGPDIGAYEYTTGQ